MWLPFRRLHDWLLRRKSKEPVLAVFFIALPEPLPFPDGAIYSFTHLGTHVPELEGYYLAQHDAGEHVLSAGEMFSSLRFWRTPVEQLLWDERHDAPFRLIQRIFPSLLNEEKREEMEASERERMAVEDGAYCTVVEAVTPLLWSRAEGEDGLTDAFERCFELIDQVVLCYRLYSGHLIPRLTREQLPPIIPFATRLLRGEAEWNRLSLFLLHFNVGPVGVDEIDRDELERFNLYFGSVSRGHPLALFSERSLDARVALNREGRFGDAVVHAETSVEVLLDAILGLMLWEEGKTPQCAAKDEFRDISFGRRVQTQFHGRLGGDWSTKSGGVMTGWADEVARTRNRVVHEGHRPTSEEARRALAVAGEVENFVRERVLAARDRYPRTALLVLGRPGLKRAGAWRGALREFAEHADEEPDWIASFRLWRDALGEARQL